MFIKLFDELRVFHHPDSLHGSVELEVSLDQFVDCLWVLRSDFLEYLRKAMIASCGS
jgi:hypothetical protein